MKILVLNCGSSSLKYQLINMETDEVLASGKYERIGEKEAFITHKSCGKKVKIDHIAMDHTEAIDFTLKQLTNPEYKVIDSLDEVSAIGHRLVHGGEKIAESVVIDENVIEVLKECTDLAPLHNPAGIMGIEACQKVMPGKPMVGVFDTAFHQTMPKEHYIYPIPYEFYKKYGIRKYGFHGTSHKYVSARIAELLGRPVEELKTVVCHLGQGASLCAVKGGKSVDTTMGLTPLGGIPMCARSGDLDPSIVTYLMKKENLTPDEMELILNKESGILGLSGVSADFRDIEAEAAKGNKRAELAISAYAYKVAQYIAQYIVSLGGLDTIVFTAGIGENQYNARRRICENLKCFGVEIDEAKNHEFRDEGRISSPNSKVEVWVVPTNEELMIARDTKDLISK